MVLISYIKKILNSKRGVTFIELMLAISILAISMTYIAYDSKISFRMIHRLNQEEKMLYAAQSAVEKFKLDHIGGTKTIDGYTIDVETISNPEQDSNLTSNLEKVILTVHPKDDSSDLLGNVVMVSYVSSSNQPPETPSNLTATPSTDSVVLDWNEASGAQSYIVKRSQTSGGPYTTIATDITVPTYTNTAVSNNVTYYYVISASNSYGESPNSNEASATIVVNTKILNPVDDSYIRGGKSSYNNYGSSQKLYFRDFMWPKHQYKTYLKFDLTSISGVISDAKLRLYGYNTAGNNLNADVHSLGDDSWTEETITWENAPAEQDVLNTITFDGNMQYKETGVKNYCTNQLNNNKLASFVVTTQSRDQGEVESKEATNKPELVVTWTPHLPPDPPQNLTADSEDRKVSLNWDTVTGAESYIVKRSTVSGGPYTTIDTGIVATDYTNTGLTNGTTYYYVVSAVNGSGESNISNEASATPNYITTVTYTPDADAHVRDGSYSNTNYGSSQNIEVKNAVSGSGDKRVAYYKFNLSDFSGQVKNAKLELYGSNVEDFSEVDLGCYEVTDNSWEENLITFNNAPILESEIGLTTVDDVASYTKIDITDYVKTQISGSKVINVATSGKGSAKLLSFNSKENTDNKPRLVIEKTLLPPNAPTDIKAIPDDGKVTLQWAASNETDYYCVYRSTTDGGPYETIANNVTSTSYEDTSVTNGTKYYYVVTAVNAAGESEYSEQVSATPNPTLTVTLNPVADASVSSYYPDVNYGENPLIDVAYDGDNNRKAYFRFDLSGYSNNTVVSAMFRIYGNADFDSFNLNAYEVSDNSWIESGTGSICWNNAPPLEAQVENTKVGTVRQYNEIDITEYISTAISTSDLVSFGLYTNEFSENICYFNSKEDEYDKPPELVVKMVEGIPKQPQNLSGIGGNTKADLSWDVADGATSYNIKRSTTSGGPYTVIASGVTDTAYTDTSVNNNTNYYYVVSGVNDIGESINSNEVCVMPQGGNISSQTLLPSDDCYVRDGVFSSDNFGGESVIEISESSTIGSGNIRHGYIKFDLSTLVQVPSDAELTVTGQNITDNKGNRDILLNIYSTNDSWDEYTLDFDNAPNRGTLLGTFSVNKHYRPQSINITDFIRSEYQADGQASLYIEAVTNDKVASLSSKEGSDSPLLTITY